MHFIEKIRTENIHYGCLCGERGENRNKVNTPINEIRKDIVQSNVEYVP